MADVSKIQLPSGDTYDIVDNKSGYMKGMTILSYGKSTWQDFINAYNSNKVVYCRASSNSNPATGSQTRLAFMAYVSNETTPTNVEFQYYRSVSSHTASQQGDQVYVYKLTNAGAWTVTTREASVKVAVGGDLTGSYSNGTYTVSGTIPDVSGLAPLASPAFTGTPTAPTPTSGDDSTKIATTAFVQDAMSGAGAGTITRVKTTAGAHTTIDVSSGAAQFNVPTNTSHLTNDSGYVTTDTKNTAGSTNSSSKLYLIGATEQSANPQTYSNSKLYYNSGLNSTVSSATLSSAITQSSTQIKLSTTENQTGGAEIEVSTSGFGVDFWDEDLLHKINYIRADLSGLALTGLVTPVNNQDAATKKYVDDSIPTVPVTDVTVGGTSVVSSGVAIIPAITDTKNTAGSTNSTSTLYLIGATEQSANPQTYSSTNLTFNGSTGNLTLTGNVKFDTNDRGLYTKDGSGNSIEAFTQLGNADNNMIAVGNNSYPIYIRGTIAYLYLASSGTDATLSSEITDAGWGSCIV